ncbi:hypothetical protein TNCV_2966941 [Trichonephila clavipes]|nr:hypothetical protein TNCV_2966941 [Trichonephila clavipes]
MAPYTIIPAVGSVCRCKAKAGSRRSPRGLHTRTRLSPLLRLNLDSVAKNDSIPFRFSQVSSCPIPLQMEASIGECQEQHM